jgi:hypothetical protein
MPSPTGSKRGGGAGNYTNLALKLDMELKLKSCLVSELEV